MNDIINQLPPPHWTGEDRLFMCRFNDNTKQNWKKCRKCIHRLFKLSGGECYLDKEYKYGTNIQA